MNLKIGDEVICVDSIDLNPVLSKKLKSVKKLIIIKIECPYIVFKDMDSCRYKASRFKKCSKQLELEF